VDEVLVWAFVNLVLSVAGLVLAGLLVFWALLHCSQKQREFQLEQGVNGDGGYVAGRGANADADYGGEVEGWCEPWFLWFLLGAVLGVWVFWCFCLRGL
jgi:hypothetical protein